MVAHATSFGVDDFSPTDNPTGSWSYGWEDGGAFQLMGSVQTYAPDVYFWQSGVNGPLDGPTIARNFGVSVLTVNNTATFAPGGFVLQPGPEGQKAVLRWTAPFAGTFTIAARFTGADEWTMSDASIREGDAYVAGGDINFHDGELDFFEHVTLQENDTFDFLVGFGANRTVGFDTTRLDVFISDSYLTQPPDFGDPNPGDLPVIDITWPQPVPDNSSPLALVALSVAGLGAFGKFSRRRAMN